MKAYNLINDRGNIANNQIVVEHNNGIIDFVSYDSHIARINKKGDLIFGKNWDYSKTTLKHLYIFLRQQGLYNYNVCKKGLQKAIDCKQIQVNNKM